MSENAAARPANEKASSDETDCQQTEGFSYDGL